MPKINAQPRATGYASVTSVAPTPPRPPVIMQQNTTYPHNEADHWTYADGTLVCLCLCLRCWPAQGGPCPDERGPVTA